MWTPHLWSQAMCSTIGLLHTQPFPETQDVLNVLDKVFFIKKMTEQLHNQPICLKGISRVRDITVFHLVLVLGESLQKYLAWISFLFSAFWLSQGLDC